MNDFFIWWNNVLLPPTVLPVAMVCAVGGSIVLAMFTRWVGTIALVINAVVLFIGAYLANVLTADLSVPLEKFYVKPIVVSCAGMSVTALLLLLLFPKNRNT